MDTTQLLFIWGVNALFEVTETLVSAFKEAEKALMPYNMKWNLLRCVTTGGSKSKCEVEKCLFEQITKLVKM